MKREDIRAQLHAHLDYMREMGLEYTSRPNTQDTAKGGNKEALQELWEKYVDGCTKCALSEAGRKNIVFGDGSPDADLMFIGEGPGADEDIQGVPFVGRAGKKLNEIIHAMGLRREEVYIANIVKCRPPDNRNPQPEEAVACIPYLESQIDIIKPKVICTLGAVSTRILLNTKQAISKIRGHFQSYHGIPLMPTYHPAYLLRNYTPKTRREMWDDMQLILEKLEQLR